MSDAPYDLWTGSAWESREMVRMLGDTSQFGESTLIMDALKLRRAAPLHRWCFECGACGPVELSSTKLFREQGWSCVLIEKDGPTVEQLRLAPGRVLVVHEEVTDLTATLENILCPWCADHFPLNADFGVIDVDGNDYWLWHDLVAFRPSVMVVEFCPYHREPGFIPPRGADVSKQAGFDVIVALGLEKRYKPLYRTYCNVIFIRDDG